ncbi:MAG: hypothetical protein J0M34_04750 [Alphaproteobacteria bacterium]|nr:hypothetical protein [Alphaproteobacteria bacterium]
MKHILPILLLASLAACDDYVPAEKKAVINPVTREITKPAPCPDWSHQTENYDNSVHSNFGCATANNIAIQLDDPADAVRGHGSGTDTESTVRTVGRYRAGEIPQPLQPLSDVGN